MRLQGETRELFVELSEAEVLQAGEELAKAVELLADERAALSTWEKSVKSARETRKEEIAGLENETADLAEIVRTGREKRDVACNWLYALPAGYAFLVRSDDGSLVTHRKLRDEERQMELGEAPFAEPTPEQLEEWLKGLPVNEEQALPEGHAEEVQAEDRAVDLGNELTGEEQTRAYEQEVWEADAEEGEDDDAIVTDEHGEPLEEPISAGATTPRLNLNPTIPELAAMSDEQVAQLARRK